MRGRRFVVLAAWVLLCALGAGCGDDDDDGTGNGEQAVVLDATDSIGGAFSISGTVTLPEGASIGRGIQLTVNAFFDDGSFRALVEPVGVTPGSTVPYQIKGLVPGNYQVGMRIDETDNGMLGDPGDFEGWFGGTVDSPILLVSAAQDILVTGQDVTGANFGLGLCTDPDGCEFI